MTTDPNVRYDIGGWISGPMLPPGSTANRELYAATVAALDCPPPATPQDERVCLRTVRDRARVVLQVIARLASDREAGAADVLRAAHVIGGRVADVPADGYDHAVSGSGSSC